MGGEVSRLRTPAGTDVFVKTGRGFERLDLLREVRNLRSLSQILPVPAVIDFQDDGSEAQLTMEGLSGVPLHEAYPLLGRQATLSLVAEILATLWRAPAISRPSVLGSVQEELEDVRLLIEQQLIDNDGFEAASGGKTPGTLYQEILTQFASHDTDVISHGDFCLPNILVDDDGRWRLIDLGKAAFGDRFRDLSTIEVSLARNVDADALRDLMAMLGIDLNETARTKMRTYTNIDLYWYNARL
jgi:aminoglycoside phosphotransferase